MAVGPDRPVGTARINMGWANQQHTVIVLYQGGKSLEMPEETYRAAGYSPPFDQLPWQAMTTN